MWKKLMLGVAGLMLVGTAGCEVYAPGPVVDVGPAFIGPEYGYGYPYRFGYYGYYGWHHGYGGYGYRHDGYGYRHGGYGYRR